MQIIKAPSIVEANYFRTVFLAGGITNCGDWQKELAEKIQALHCPCSLYNPRRDDFSNQTVESAEQIAWEYVRLRSVKLVSFWFARETVQPITLFELGAALERNQQVVIGIDPSYERWFDVVMQANLRRPGISIVHSLNDLANAIVQGLNK